MTRRFRSALFVVAAITFLSCMKEYPTVRLGEFMDVQANLANLTGLARFDSLHVEFRDGRDTGRIVSAWTVGPDSLSKIPLQYHPEGQTLLVRIRGFLDSVGYCYTAWVLGNQVLDSTDSCSLMPRIVDIRTLSPADTIISIDDSVVFRATVSSQNGTLREFHWDFDRDGAPDSIGPLAGFSATLQVTRHFGNQPGSFGVWLTVLDADSNAAFKQAMVHVDLDAPRALAGTDRTVVLGDSIILKGESSDGIGKIVSAGWYGIGDTALLSTGDRLNVSGKELGVKAYVYRVFDDDGLGAADTLSVTTILPEANASLRAIYLFPGTLNPEFSAAQRTYQLLVPAGTDSLKLTARPSLLQSTVTLLDSPDSATGDLFRTLPFTQAETLLRIGVRSPAGAETEYQIKVSRDTGGDGTSLGYARVLDPSATGAILAGGVSFNSAGKPVGFSRIAAGRYHLVFPDLGARGGQGHVQVTTYGAVPGHCSVASWGGPDFGVDLACSDAKGAGADLPFGVSVSWPRAQSTGGNGFISNDIVPAAVQQKAKAVSAYNSFNGAATGEISVMRGGPGITETTFFQMSTDAENTGNALVALHGPDSGWCRVASLYSIGADLVVRTSCFRTGGAPSDFLFSVSVVSPILGSRDFGVAYARVPGPSGFADSLPDPDKSFNSGGGAITYKRIGTGRVQLRFPGLETSGPERTGIAHVSAYGEMDSGFCQVEAWSPVVASATILCSDAQGFPEDTPFSIRVLR